MHGLNTNTLKETTWHESLTAIQKKVTLSCKGKRPLVDVPIVFVENSRRNSMMTKDGIRCLWDETPILSTLMYHVFKVISPIKIPALFLSMAGNLQDSSSAPSKTTTLVKHSAPIDMKGKEEKDADARPVLNEHQKALNAAATKVVEDPIILAKLELRLWFVMNIRLDFFNVLKTVVLFCNFDCFYLFVSNKQIKCLSIHLKLF